ncbi:hypothetical protein O3M35_000812 [Rhynocoris fuscipes]|uniref:Uncharacterized protein n=1 Tax=Rhynocoris fuscipes TaxID=488301 RepID=A0AAW1DN22_9HEMI
MMGFNVCRFHYTDKYEQVTSVFHPSVITAAALIAIYTAWTLFRIKIPGCSLVESIQLKVIQDEPCDVYSEKFCDKNKKNSRTFFLDQKNNIIENIDPKFNSILRSNNEYHRSGQSKEYEDEEYTEAEEESDEQLATQETDDSCSEAGEFDFEEERGKLNRITYYDIEQEDDEQYLEDDLFKYDDFEEEEDINIIIRNDQEDNDKIDDQQIDGNEMGRMKVDDNVLEGDDSYFSSGSSDMWSDDGCLTVRHVSDVENENEPNIIAEL